MQKKAKQYSAEEKTKIVLETLKGELSMAQIIPIAIIKAVYLSSLYK